MSSIFYILIGWALGLVSPWVLELTQRPYKRSQIRRSLFVEFRDLRVKLAAVAFQLASNRGEVDKQFLEWIEPIFSTHPRTELAGPMSEAVRAIKSLNNKNLETVVAMFRKTGHGWALKKYSLPFLTNQITALNLFSPEFQRLALETQAILSMINEDIDMAWFYYCKTFESSLSETNRRIINLNLEQTYAHILGLSRQVVDNITLILSMDG